MQSPAKEENSFNVAMIDHSKHHCESCSSSCELLAAEREKAQKLFEIISQSNYFVLGFAAGFLYSRINQWKERLETQNRMTDLEVRLMSVNLELDLVSRKQVLCLGQMDYRGLELPAAFNEFVQKCKTIKLKKLFLQPAEDHYTIVVDFENEEQNDAFIRVYTELTLAAVEYDFDVVVSTIFPRGLKNLMEE